MPRMLAGVSRERINRLRRTDPKRLGPKLGEVALVNNVPADAIAAVLMVTTTTIYNWFYDRTAPQKAAHRNDIKSLLFIFAEAESMGLIPVHGTKTQRIEAINHAIAVVRGTA